MSESHSGIAAAAVSQAIRLALRAVGARQLPPHDQEPFYTPPTRLPKEPGRLLKSERTKFYIDPFQLVQAPGRAYRIMFTSRDRNGKIVPVTGTMMTSSRSKIPVEERGMVAFAVGTQGMGSQCAPSRQMAAGTEYESVFIAGLLNRGFNVVVPDYHGLGVDGTHTYMARVAQGHVVLDALRAGHELESPDVAPGAPVAIVGYSQGGAAAGSAAELWHEYAPDLDLKGAVCGAVPADLGLVARTLDGGPYFGFLGYALVGLATEYRIDLSPLLNDRGNEIAAALNEQCMFESLRRYAFTRSATLTRDGRTIAEHFEDEAFRAIVDEQRLGNGRWPRVEVLISHSRLDDVIPYECGRALAERWAAQGAKVRFASSVAPTHAAAALRSYSTTYAFLNARFAGKPMRTHTRRYLHNLLEGAKDVGEPEPTTDDPA